MPTLPLTTRQSFGSALTSCFRILLVAVVQARISPWEAPCSHHRTPLRRFVGVCPCGGRRCVFLVTDWSSPLMICFNE